MFLEVKEITEKVEVISHLLSQKVEVTKLSTHLNVSPSMGAVTLLALGNGAPDVFASVAAVGGGNPRTGFGAILSAGAFVSAPFAVSPAPFIRGVLFYLTAVPVVRGSHVFFGAGKEGNTLSALLFDHIIDIYARSARFGTYN
ncbi:hypothetical protein LXL04_011974 [Taraxacum kok-saghyz]